MTQKLIFLLAAFSWAASSQPWSTFLDPSRAIDWTSVGFTIPNYTVDCSTQPTLTADDPTKAAANTLAIQNALASCNATHNVVNIPAGTYYVAGLIYGSQGKQILRGAGPMSTTLTPTAVVGCGFWMSFCMMPSSLDNRGMAKMLPPAGTQQCAWTGGLSQASTVITLSSCGGSGPPVGALMVLDQANDSADTGGETICDSTSFSGCAAGTGNMDGRVIGTVTHSQQQYVLATAVTKNGGTYTVTLSNPVYFTNIRATQSPGAYWIDYVQNDGIENLTIDHSYLTSGPNGNWSAIALLNCYQCWVKNVRSLYGPRSEVFLYGSLNSVVRDSYFYGSQGTGSQSYGIEFEGASGNLIENNIFQQVTTPIVFGQGSGNVVGYNYSINNIYSPTTFMMALYYSHNAGNEMNLWEGNNMDGVNSDPTWGASTVGTLFRNIIIGWQSGRTNSTYPVSLETWSRAYNVVGNVLGQPGYHNIYESYATSTTSGVNGGGAANRSIYVLGWTGLSGAGGCSGPPTCDPLVRPTLMRWGNYDVVTDGATWNSTEASPAAVPYVNSNFSSSYFSSLAHTLSASLYYSSTPSWWPAAKAWPPVGPDVSSGNLGICSGTYAGAQATASSQCTGGGWTSAWAAHANSIPAQDCFLNFMHGPPDGSGNVLNFDINLCRLASPTGLRATAQ